MLLQEISESFRGIFQHERDKIETLLGVGAGATAIAAGAAVEILTSNSESAAITSAAVGILAVGAAGVRQRFEEKSR